MNTENFIEELTLKFPKSAATIAQWTKTYLHVIDPVPEDRLEDLLEGVLRSWQKSVAPLPADFVEKVKALTPKATVSMYGNSFWHRVRVRSRNMVNRFEAGLSTTLEIEHRAHILWLFKDKAWMLAQQIEAGRFPEGTEVVMTEADYDNARDRFTSQRDNHARFAKRGLAGFKTLSATG
jgi:hypothetical protein